MAVGSYTQEGGTPAEASYSVANSFDGISWSVQASPASGSDEDQLYGASCPPTGSCEAVGVTTGIPIAGPDGNPVEGPAAPLAGPLTFGGGPATLFVSAGGAGAGTITSDPAGIDCPGTCSATFAPLTQVKLTATIGSSPPSVFGGWGDGIGGPCPGTSLTCVVTLSSGANYTSALFEPFTANFTAASTQVPTGNDTVAVALSACADYGIGTLTWTLDQIGTGQPHAPVSGSGTASTCSFTPHLAPGDWKVTLQATSADGRLTASNSQTVTVLPEVQFNYTVKPDPLDGPLASPLIPVDVSACDLSSGVDEYDWSISDNGRVAGPSHDSSSCSASWEIPAGTDPTVTLKGIDTATSLDAQTSDTFSVFAYDPTDTNSQCSVAWAGADACWRQDGEWTADVLSHDARAPDYALVAISGGALGASQSTYADLTCDGNLYVGQSYAFDIGSGSALSLQALAGFGWVGDPTGPEPYEDWVDSYVGGPADAPPGPVQVGVNALVVGLNFTSSPSALGPKDGIEYYASTPGLGVSLGTGSATGVPPVKSPSASQECPSDGVLGTAEFQRLTNIPNLPNYGYQIVSSPTSGTSPTETVNNGNGNGNGAEVYVLSSGWEPGLQTKLTLHSKPRRLGSAVANDKGRIGRPILIPSNIPAGHHEIIITGIGSNGKRRTVKIRIKTTARPKPLSRRQRLARAIKVCRRLRSTKRRARCITVAKRRYAA